MKTSRLGILILVAVGLLTSPAPAQVSVLRSEAVPAGQAPETYGTLSNIVYTAGSSDFYLFQGTEAPLNGSTTMRSCSSGACGWLAPLRLPSGASIISVELSACDGDAGGEVQFSLFSQAKPAENAVPLASASTSIPGTPGCAGFIATLATQETVDNNAKQYIFDVVADTGSNLGFLSFRANYKLQVSPAPGVATFGDVPTSSPQFRFVEALAAAGITAGCGGGNYCPNDPITRGQMAVFLASALGLHWPN